MVNPEFTRNLWLEFSVHRLIAMPMMLGLAFTMTYLLEGGELGAAVRIITLAGFVVICAGWGMRLAANALLEEVRVRTWDIQKLSALPPWSMTWGKLLGATVFAWYGGALCIASFFLAGGASPESVKLAASAVLLAVVLQACALSSALLGVRRRPDRAGSINTMGAVAALLIVAIMLKDVLLPKGDLRWYGYLVPRLDFALASLAVFAGWSLVGAYRLMCQELAVRTLPWLWPAFTLFLGVYLAGIGVVDRAASLWPTLLHVSFVTAVVLSYLIAFWDRKDPLDVRQVFIACSQRRFRRCLQELPPWFLSMLVALACAAALLGVPADAPFVSALELPPLSIAAIPVFLLALRDIALLHYFSFAPLAQRPELTTLIYLALLYWLAPGLLKLLELNALALVLLPPLTTRPILSTLIAGAHLVIVLWLLRGRWRRRTRVPS